MADSTYRGPVRAFWAVIFLAVCIGLGLLPLRRPSVVPADAPADAFSAERALRHLEHIARSPRPVGSPANLAARDYIFEQLRAEGTEARLQSGHVRRGNQHFQIHNIVGRLPGLSGGRAVVLACHYDSAPTSPGAGDDGSAVAAVLETIRALREGPQLAHDLVVLFTDAEEDGLLGARYFVDNDPLAKQVAVVLNFEARGTGGPVHMFQTSQQNYTIVREFLKAAPHPLANSLSAAIYRQMPNGTDLTVFMNAGLPGLNFAYIGEPWNYHTPDDNLASLDLSSMQHQGSYMLSLARHFGRIDISANEPGGPSVFFNILGHWVICYPTSLVWPLTAISSIWALLILALAIRTGKMRPRGILAGLLAFPLAIAAGVLAGWIPRQVLMWFVDASPMPGNPVMRYAHLVTAAMVLVACAGFVFTYRPFMQRWSLRELTAGAAILWTLGLIGLSHLIPEGTFLLLIPVAAWAISAAFELAAMRMAPKAASCVAVTVPAATTLIVFTPMALSLFVAIPPMLAPITTAASLLPLSFCLWHVAALTGPRIRRMELERAAVA